MSSGFDVVKKNSDGTCILQNGMRIKGQYQLQTDEKGVTTITGNQLSIWGTSGKEEKLIIKTNDSIMDFHGGGDKNIKIFGDRNKVDEVNDANTKKLTNEFELQGNDNIFRGGVNTLLKIKGDWNAAKASKIEADCKNSYLEGTSQNDSMNVRGKDILVKPLSGDDYVDIIAGENITVADNDSVEDNTVVRGDSSNTAKSKTLGKSDRFKNETADEGMMIINQKNGKKVAIPTLSFDNPESDSEEDERSVSAPKKPEEIEYRGLDGEIHLYNTTLGRRIK